MTALTASGPKDLRALPKGHLHVHLEAAMRPATLAELADSAGVVVPEISGFDGFAAFASMYQGILAVLAEPASFERLFDEAIADAAADGVVYIEFGISPQFYRHVYGTLEQSLDRHVELGLAAGERHGVEVGFMITIDRTDGAEPAQELALLAATYANRGVSSLGLANEERGFPPEEFQDAFAVATAAGVYSAPHAGELVGPESVWGALTSLNAHRIQHGVRAVEDEELLAELARRGTCLDVCITSNYILKVIDDLATHPLPLLLEHGIACSINADDPLLFGPGILDEYELARGTLGLTDEQLALCAWNSIACTRASEHTKVRARAGIDAWLAGEKGKGAA